MGNGTPGRRGSNATRRVEEGISGVPAPASSLCMMEMGVRVATLNCSRATHIIVQVRMSTRVQCYGVMFARVLQ